MQSSPSVRCPIIIAPHSVADYIFATTACARAPPFTAYPYGGQACASGFGPKLTSLDTLFGLLLGVAALGKFLPFGQARMETAPHVSIEECSTCPRVMSLVTLRNWKGVLIKDSLLWGRINAIYNDVLQSTEDRAFCDRIPFGTR